MHTVAYYVCLAKCQVSFWNWFDTKSFHAVSKATRHIYTRVSTMCLQICRRHMRTWRKHGEFPCIIDWANSACCWYCVCIKCISAGPSCYKAKSSKVVCAKVCWCLILHPFNWTWPYMPEAWFWVVVDAAALDWWTSEAKLAAKSHLQSLPPNTGWIANIDVHCGTDNRRRAVSEHDILLGLAASIRYERMTPDQITERWMLTAVLVVGKTHADHNSNHNMAEKSIKLRVWISAYTR